MAYAVVLEAVPSRIVAGESVSWKWLDSNFPPATWTLTYSFLTSSARFQAVATASSDYHLVEIPASTSADYAAGTYNWQAHVSNGTERYKVAEGVIEVVTDFGAAAQSSGYDSRSHVKKVLDLLEAVIEGRASKTQMTQNVGGVQVSHISPETLLKLRGRYRRMYQNELVEAGKAKSRRIVYSRFRNTNT